MENTFHNDSFVKDIDSLKPGLFYEYEGAFNDLNEFFDLEQEEDKVIIKSDIMYVGTDSAYHNFGILGTNITFCLLKAEFSNLTHTFKDIDFFITEPGMHGITLDIAVTPEYVLDHLPENIYSLLAIQLGKLYRGRKF